MDTSPQAIAARLLQSSIPTHNPSTEDMDNTEFRVKFDFFVAAASAEAEDKAAAPALSLDEYKQAFHAKIDSYAIHPSLSGMRQSITIAPELYEKMMNDPELEAKVLGQIEETLTTAWPYPAIGAPAFCATSFDADGEYSATSGGSAHLGKFEAMSANAAWRYEPTASVATAMSKDDEKSAEAAKVKKKKKIEELLNNLAQQRRENMRAMQDAYRKKVSGEADYVPGPESVVRPSVLESLIL